MTTRSAGRPMLAAAALGALLGPAAARAQTSLFDAPRDFVAAASPFSLAVGDLDGDGAPDVASANFGSNDVAVLLGNHDGTLRAALTFPAGTNPHGLAAGDFNGDGRRDLAVANFGSNNISILIGSGGG